MRRVKLDHTHDAASPTSPGEVLGDFKVPKQLWKRLFKNAMHLKSYMYTHLIIKACSLYIYIHMYSFPYCV